MRLSSVQLKMTGELWAGYLHRMEHLQKEQQHLTRRLGETQARQEHLEGSVQASNALMLETEALLQNLCLQREHIIHLIRRFLLEVLTPFQVGASRLLIMCLAVYSGVHIMPGSPVEHES